MKKIIKVSGVFLVMVFTLITCMSRTNAYGAQKKFDVTIKYGYDNEAKFGKYMPVRFEFSNVKDDFEGTINLYIGATESYMVEKDFVISKGEEKVIVIPVMPSNAVVNIEYDILSKKGKIVDSGKKTIKSKLIYDTAYVGIISDDYQALTYINDLKLYNNNVRLKTFKLTEEDIFDEYRGLDMFELIVINNYNLENLSDTQIDTIEDWTKNGGRLLVGTGENGKKSYAKFEEIGQLFDVDSLSDTMWTTSDSTSFSISSYNVICENSISLFKGNDGKDVAKKLKFSDGYVSVVGFDMGLKAYSDLIAKDNSSVTTIINSTLGEEIFTELMNSDMSMGQFNTWYLMECFGGMIDKEMPNLIVLSIVIVLYVAVIIPVVFVVLKKCDKSKYMYMTLILSSVIVCLIIYGIGSKSRFSRPFISYVSVLEKIGDEVNENVVLGAKSADNGTYKFNVDGNYDIELMNNYWYDDENNTNPRDYRVGMKNVTDETQITIRKTASFEDRFLALDRKRSLESFPDVDFKLTIFNGRVEGAITNNSDKKIEDAVAIIGEKFIVLGDIEPGQKVDVVSKYACTWYNNYNNAITDISECEDEDTKKIRDNFYEMQFMKMQDIWYNITSSSISVGVTTDNSMNMIYFFTDESEKNIIEGNCDTTGITAYAINADISNEKNGQVYYDYIPSEIDISKNSNADAYGDSEVYFYGNNANYFFDVNYTVSGCELDTISFVSREDMISKDDDYMVPFDGTISVLDKENNIYIEIEEPYKDVSMSELNQYIWTDSWGNEKLTFKFEHTGNTGNSSYDFAVVFPKLTGKGSVK